MTPWQELIAALCPQQSTWERLLAGLLSSTALSGLRGRHNLRKYQDKTIDLIKAIWEPEGPPGVIVALEPGAGKTVSTLTAVRDLLDAGKIKRVLLVAPLLVAETVWHAEIEEWAHLTHTTYSHVTGDLKKRSAAFESDAEIHIINKELVPWLWEFAKDKWKYDCLVIDEASMLKNGKKRTPNKNLTRFGALAQARKHFTGVVELTGTPAPNGVKNLWGLAYIIDQGARLGRSKNAFNERWIDFNKYTYEEKPKPGAEEEIMSKMKDIMFSLDPKDYVELPPLVENVIKVKLPPKVLKEYQKFKKTLVYEPEAIEAVNAAVLAGKLLQACISKDTEVLCQRGWVKIQDVEKKDKVWDGEEWVSSEGSIFKGVKPTYTCFGVDMTSDHKVLTKSGWRKSEDILNGNACGGFDRAEVRLPDGAMETWIDHGENEVCHMDVSMRLRKHSDSGESVSAQQGEGVPSVLRVQNRPDDFSVAGRSHDDRDEAIPNLDSNEGAVPQSKAQGFQELRCSGYRHARRVVSVVQEILGGCARRLFGQTDHRQNRQRRPLLEAKLPMDELGCSGAEQTLQCDSGYPVGSDHCGGGRRKVGAEVCHGVSSSSERGERSHPSAPNMDVEVYDLLNCGPRNRYVVRGTDGPLIVHNCSGHLYNEDKEAIWLHDCKLDALENLVSEIGDVPLLVAYGFKSDKERIKKKFPKAIVLNEQKDVMQTVKDWNDGKIDMLLTHPASAAWGLNLQKGSNHFVWYSLTVDLELFQQFRKRLWRSGQQAERVWSHTIVAEGTIDETLIPVLSDKDAVQTRVLQATMLDISA